MPEHTSSALEFATYAVLVGIGATLFMDGWALLMKYLFGIPFPRYDMVGRWVGHMPRGVLAHLSIGEAASVRSELAIGWVVHYLTGVCFAFLLVVVWGLEWVHQPTLFPAIFIGLITLIFPFLIMQPAFGLGIAASKMPEPDLARLRSMIAHLSFGVGMYLSGQAVSKLTGN